MNYLAHLFLSGDDPSIIKGNFIADAVKGNKYLIYPPGIISGVKLHRFIDYFTDQHPLVEQSKARLRVKFRKYAGVIVDVFYDHFLAKNFEKFSNTNLLPFTENIYKTLMDDFSSYPEKIQFMLPYMIKDNWLYNYRKLEGIQMALEGLSRRTSFHSNMENATEELFNNYELFENEFFKFFPILIENAEKFRNLGQH
jgi:acyl carrier protein phosphodiesterase